MDIEEAKLRTEQQRARQLQLSNDEHEGKLIRREDIERVWTEWMAEWRTQIEAMPAQLASARKLNAVQMGAVRSGLDAMVQHMIDFSKRQERLKPAKVGKSSAPAEGRRTRQRALGTGKGRVGRKRKDPGGKLAPKRK